jgi:protein phosphatase
VAHVGDSRVYRLRGNRLQQLTFDHSLVWEMRAAGQGTGPEGPFQIPRNVITRSLGPQPAVQIDLEGPHEIQLHDTFLICSDGLTTRLTDHEIGLVLGSLEPAAAARMLVDLANIRGGADNITVMVARAEGPAVTSRAAKSEPLVVGHELRPQHSVHVGVWIGIAVSALLAAGLAVLQLYLPALVAALMGLAFVPVAILQKYPRSGGVALTHGRRLGRGPYVTVDCPVTAAVLQDLGRSVRGALELDPDSLLANRSRIEACLDETAAQLEQGNLTAAAQMLAVATRVFAESLRRGPGLGG